MNTPENSDIIRLTNDDFNRISQMLGGELAALMAVQQVKIGGRGGFFAPGKPAILFEGHIFWNQLKKKGLHPEDYVNGNETILYPRWTKQYYKGSVHEYEHWEQARKINREAADASASWGMFQIIGFNHAACGEESVESFVRSMCESEYKQLFLFANFIKNNPPMLRALQSKDWTKFAKCYNGPGYAQNRYDVKLGEAYGEFKE